MSSVQHGGGGGDDGFDIISCRLNILDEWLFHDAYFIFDFLTKMYNYSCGNKYVYFGKLLVFLLCL